MSLLLKGFIRDGRVELDEPTNLPEGTEVVVAPQTNTRKDHLMTPDEIERVLKAMEQLLPLDIPNDVESDLDNWEHKLNQHGIDRADSGSEDMIP